MPRLTLLLAVISTGLYAGFCFAYAITVKPALSTLADDDYVVAVRAINTATPSIPFAVIFAGSGILLAAAITQNLHTGTAILLLGGAVACYIAVVAVTFLCNVPLNATLATTGDATTLRHQFEHSWNTYHGVRTGLAVIAFTVTAAVSAWPSSVTSPATPSRPASQVPADSNHTR